MQALLSTSRGRSWLPREKALKRGAGGHLMPTSGLLLVSRSAWYAPGGGVLQRGGGHNAADCVGSASTKRARLPGGHGWGFSRASRAFIACYTCARTCRVLTMEGQRETGAEHLEHLFQVLQLGCRRSYWDLH